MCGYKFYFAAEVYERVAFNPNAPGLDGLQWDSAELYKVGVHGSYICCLNSVNICVSGEGGGFRVCVFGNTCVYS